MLHTLNRNHYLKKGSYILIPLINSLVPPAKLAPFTLDGPPFLVVTLNTAESVGTIK